MFAPDVKNRQVAVMFMTDFYLLLNRNSSVARRNFVSGS
jgi:hypothetical protein